MLAASGLHSQCDETRISFCNRLNRLLLPVKRLVLGLVYCSAETGALLMARPEAITRSEFLTQENVRALPVEEHGIV